VSDVVNAKPFAADSPITETIKASPQEKGEESNSNPKSVQALPGQKLKMEGVIINGEADSFTLRNASGSELTVLLSSATKVEERKSNPFRSAKRYSRNDLIRGLTVEVEGRGDSSGTLLAEKVRFKNDDLTVAHTVESQVTPIESRLGHAEKRLSETEQNEQRLSGEVDELVELANVARGGAKAAQETADRALAGVNKTHERISALDDYELRNSLIINFKVGSALLLPEAKAKLDEIAAAAQAEKGFVIEVTGFASADGPANFNRQLSQQRAETVTRYLVEKHGIPLRRILIPYGYGALNPVADNATRVGRRQNRRVEVKLLVNRGLTMPAGADNPTTTGSNAMRMQQPQTHSLSPSR
jgi:outer membrane protein OmpA-like peptidoglycan-associated protein